VILMTDGTFFRDGWRKSLKTEKSWVRRGSRGGESPCTNFVGPPVASYIITLSKEGG